MEAPLSRNITGFIFATSGLVVTGPFFCSGFFFQGASFSVASIGSSIHGSTSLRNRFLQSAHSVTKLRMPVAMACVAFVACTSLASVESTDGLWDKLGQGGYILLMPHASAQQAVPSQPELGLERCTDPDHLSSQGRREAQWLKDQLRHHAVSVGRVLTGHDCRCVETAGAVFEIAEPWSVIDDARDEDAETARANSIALREAISCWTSDDNLAIVTHRENIREALGVDAQPAELLIVEPLGDGGFRLLGRLRPD